MSKAFFPIDLTVSQTYSSVNSAWTCFICGQLFSFAWKSEAGLLNKRLMLSLSFRCEQIYKFELYDFSPTLLSYLSQT